MSATKNVTPELTRCVDPDAVACAAVERIVAAAHEAIAARGRFVIALAGGSTPEATYRRLASAQHAARVDWSRTLVVMGDERVVHVDDPRSNFGMARRALLDHVPVPARNVLPVRFESYDGDDAARRAAATYAHTLAGALSSPPDGPPPRIDLVLLGLGDDGHTASLFPHAAALDERRAWVTWSPPGTLPPPVNRVTFTYPMLDAARAVVFLVTGAKKSAVVAEVLGGGADHHVRPSAGVRPIDGTVTWIVDEDAAGGLARPDAGAASGASPYRLLISDIDGTLTTPDRSIADSTRDAVAALRRRGIALSLVSSRPPRGMRPLVEALRPTGTLAALNGAALVGPDGRVLSRRTIDPAAVREVVSIIRGHGIDVWLHAGDDWLVADRHGVHVDRESQAVGYAPTVVADISAHVDGVAKIVGVSDDHDAIKQAELAIEQALGDRVSASRSQAHYVDVVAPGVDKGLAVREIAASQKVDLRAVAAIGDGDNDTPMFAIAGLGIAMGNAVADVQRRAARVTTGNGEDGFARAVARWIVGSGNR